MTTTPAPHPSPSGAVDQLLAAVEAGRGAESVAAYSPDAVVDATVPGWRFHMRGRDAIAAEYANWFKDPAIFEELDRVQTPTGEVVMYLISWTERGVPHAAHHCHVLSLDPSTGLIDRERVFCGGRWDATALAAMAEADNAG